MSKNHQTLMIRLTTKLNMIRRKTKLNLPKMVNQQRPPVIVVEAPVQGAVEQTVRVDVGQVVQHLVWAVALQGVWGHRLMVNKTHPIRQVVKYPKSTEMPAVIPPGVKGRLF
jgi:hypothetical protein